MDDAEIRFKCLEMAREIQRASAQPMELTKVAENLYRFVVGVERNQTAEHNGGSI